MVQESINEGDDNVNGAVVFCFELAVYAVVGEETMECVGDVQSEQGDVETGARELLLNGGEDGVEVLKDEVPDGSERKLELKGSGTDKEVFRPERFDGREIDEPEDTVVKTVREFEGKDVVRRELCCEFLENIGLDE